MRQSSSYKRSQVGTGTLISGRRPLSRLLSEREAQARSWGRINPSARQNQSGRDEGKGERSPVGATAAGSKWTDAVWEGGRRGDPRVEGQAKCENLELETSFGPISSFLLMRK